MKQRVVIKVRMSDYSPRFSCFGPQSSRCRVMRAAATFAGVQSVAFVGDDRDRIEVIGERIDAATLVVLLRKKVGIAEIVAVTEVRAGGKETSEGGNTSSETTVGQPVIWPYDRGAPRREITYVPHYSDRQGWSR